MAFVSSKSILVTGGAGCIGSHVVDLLIKRGDKVIVLDNFNDYYSPKQKRRNIESSSNSSRFSLVEADIRDKEVFDQIFNKTKIDCVVHLAARAGVRPSLENPQLYWDVNVMGSLNLLEAMNKFEIKQLVFASSSSVYGNRNKGPFVETDNTDMAVSPYGASKKALEVLAASYAHLYGIKTTGLRFFTVYGPRNRPDMACYLFLDAISKGRSLKQFGDGTSGRDYTFVKDIAAGVVASIDNPLEYELINLGNSTPIKLKELISTTEAIVGKSAVIDLQPNQPGDVNLTFADTSKAKKILDWESKTGIKSGLLELLSWYKSI